MIVRSMKLIRSMKVSIIALIIIAIASVTVSAALTITANPSIVNVKVNSSNYTTVIFSDNVNTTGAMSVSYNVTTGTGYISAQLSGPYLDSNFTIPYNNTTTPISNTGSINWNGPLNETYYFKLTIYASSTAPNSTYTIALSGAAGYINNTSIVITTVGATVFTPVTSEIFTLALVGAGAVSLILLRRRI